MAPVTRAASDAGLDRAVDDVIEILRADRALVEDGPALLRHLAAFDGRGQRAIAQHARGVWQHEVSTGGDIDRAQGAALVARALHGALGDEEESLRAGFDYLQTRFMIANDLGAYARVRQQLGVVAARASQRGMHDLTFDAAVAVADCSLFALMAATPGEQRAVVADALLGDLRLACETLEACPDCRTGRPATYDRFVSLATAAYEAIEQAQGDSATRSAWLPDEASEAALAGRLRTLAAATEALVPDDFAFRDDAGGRTAQSAGTLARLSSTYGSAKRARARLRAALPDG